MNEMDCGRWNESCRLWTEGNKSETWTIKYGLTEMRWNMNNEVDDVTKSLEINDLRVSLDRLILGRYSLLEADLPWFYYSLSLNIKQEIQHGVRSGIRTHAHIRGPEMTSKNFFVQTKADIPSNITTPPVRTKSGHIIKKPKRYLEEYWIVKYLLNEQIQFFINKQIELFFNQSKKQKTECVVFIFDLLVKSLNSKRGMLHYWHHCSCFISFSSVNTLLTVFHFYFFSPQTISFISPTTVHLVHVYYIWLYSCYMVITPHC